MPVKTLIPHGSDFGEQATTECTRCHGPEGRGDGPQAGDLFDDWNKRKRGASSRQFFTLPLAALPPRNFREGVFRGGDRPINLYLRIHVGIKGTPMPAFGPAGGNPGALTPEQIWDVVVCVKSLRGR